MRKKAMIRILVFIPVASLVNLVLAELNMFFSLPLFMDSIGTAVGAALLGPGIGIAIAIITQAGFEVIHGMTWIYAPWVICSIATALIVGVAARRGFFDYPYQAILVGFLVALANALLGAWLHVVLFQGFTEHSTDMIVQGFQLLIDRLFWAALWARIPLNLLDKGLAVAIAYGILKLHSQRSSKVWDLDG